jgi:hypothetical protein
LRDSPDTSIVARPSFISREIAVLVDVRREVERMLPHEALCKLGVAALERFDDLHVIDDRPRRAVALQIVILRIARTWTNRFSIVLPMRCEPDSRMIA